MPTKAAANPTVAWIIAEKVRMAIDHRFCSENSEIKKLSIARSRKCRASVILCQQAIVNHPWTLASRLSYPAAALWLECPA